MTDDRKFEIGYKLLVLLMQEEELLLDDTFKRIIDAASETINIPIQEVREFAEELTYDVALRRVL